MKITAEPRSDQWNAEDFIQGPRTFTIAGVKEGAAEQKYDIVLEGSDRVWRPPLTVLRILLSAWGDEAEKWVGHRATLYRDESIRFGPSEVGGIRVSHLSHIDKPLRVNLSEKRGSRKVHTVQPLIERDWNAELALAADNIDAVAALGKAASDANADPATVGKIRARYTELKPA
jgi:hypothetical protein